LKEENLLEQLKLQLKGSINH